MLTMFKIGTEDEVEFVFIIAKHIANNKTKNEILKNIMEHTFCFLLDDLKHSFIIKINKNKLNDEWAIGFITPITLKLFLTIISPLLNSDMIQIENKLITTIGIKKENNTEIFL